MHLLVPQCECQDRAQVAIVTCNNDSRHLVNISRPTNKRQNRECTTLCDVSFFINNT